MKKGLLKIALLSAVCASMPAAITSCKNYDDDLDQIRNEMGDMKVDITKLQALIEQGCVITGVSQSSDGVVFTTSDGKTYSISNGKDGKPGTAWTIGDDGYWYENGTKTGYRAIGEQGVQGPKGDKGDPGKDGVDGKDGQNGTNGKDGVDGKDGQNGQYYVPNVETGMFDIYQDGKKIGESNISWRSVDPATVTAVYSGNCIYVSCLDSEGNPVTKRIVTGNPVGSIAFIPSVLSKTVPGYATTDEEFFHIDSYLDETKFNATTHAFTPQTQWNKSNYVSLNYRVSPEDANVADAWVKFISRDVASRYTATDKVENSVLSVRPFSQDELIQTNANHVLTVKAYYNKLNKAETGKSDLVAMKCYLGQEGTEGAGPYITDYIAAESKSVSVSIGNKTTSSTLFTARTKAISSSYPENDAFVKSFVPLSADYDLLLSQQTPLDLAPYVALWGIELNRFLDENNEIDGVSYEYTLPKEYLAADVDKTNQQKFITSLDGSVVTAHTGASAVDRTPVVRVDAFMTDNSASAKRLVASAYIKLKITDGKVDKPDVSIALDTKDGKVDFDYHSFSSTPSAPLAFISWERFNNEVYDNESVNLKATDFWKFYGGTSDEYTIVITAKDKSGKDVIVNKGATTATAGTPYSFASEGIFCDVNLVANGTETSVVKVRMSNQVHTGNYYKTDNSHGKNAAEYDICITIKSDDKHEHADVVLSQKIYVFEGCPDYNYSGSYYYDADGTPCITAIGRVNSTTTKWEMEANIAQLFDNTKYPGQDIFQFYNAVYKNYTDIKFELLPPTTGFSFTPTVSGGKQTAGVIALTADIKDDQTKTAHMRYVRTLVNGETCITNFNVVFVNPFTSGVDNGTSFNGNNIGTLAINTAEFVKVVEKVSGEYNTIYSWDETANALMLGEAAAGFGLTASDVQVSYAFKANADYNSFKNNLDKTSVFNIDANGVIHYQNQGGAQLQREYNLTVVATVTFNGHIVVTNEIPVKVTTK